MRKVEITCHNEEVRIALQELFDSGVASIDIVSIGEFFIVVSDDWFIRYMEMIELVSTTTFDIHIDLDDENHLCLADCIMSAIAKGYYLFEDDLDGPDTRRIVLQEK